MTKKDYKVLAHAMREAKLTRHVDVDTFGWVLAKLMDALQADNPHFNQLKFLQEVHQGPLAPWRP